MLLDEPAAFELIVRRTRMLRFRVIAFVARDRSACVGAPLGHAPNGGVTASIVSVMSWSAPLDRHGLADDRLRVGRGMALRITVGTRHKPE